MRVPLCFILVMAALPAAANIRAPMAADGSFSEHMRARGAHADAVLLRERFVARMPSLTTSSGYDLDLHARIEVEYDIGNTSPNALRLPVRFLAIGADDASVRVNGVDVDVRRIADEDERRGARMRIAQHRCAWSANNFSGLMAQVCSGDANADAHTLDKRYADRTRGSDVQLDSLAFDVELQPGANTIRVAYRQALRFREGPYGYFTGVGVRGARYGFEYLLYPAESWRRADDFTFDVLVDVPDVRERGWFGDSFVPATVHTNLLLDVARQPHPGTKVSGTLRSFPAEVFALVVEVPRDDSLF